MRNHRICSRPHVQGEVAPLRVRHSARNLTDGGGLILVRRLWDNLGLGSWIDHKTQELAGFFRPSLMVEAWVVLLLYGGRVLDDLPLLDRRGIRRLFGWTRLPDPTTFGRWLRRAGKLLVPLLDELLWHVVRRRWRHKGVPRALTLILDSTVSVRYGLKQAGAVRGYNPRKPGRPSHHPLLAFVQETDDCMGIRWRPGDAHTAAGAEAWITDLVGRLRSVGVETITVRLDKGFFSRSMVRTLDNLDVRFLLKVPAHQWLANHQQPWRHSRKGKHIVPGHELWTTSGRMWGVRLLSLQTRRPLAGDDNTLELDTYEVLMSAHLLTNIEGIHALTAWRRYNRGAVVEQRIKELGQLGAGATAIDDLDGNALLWALGAIAYQLLHTIRTTALSGAWRTAQPNRLRLRLFRLPAKLTRHSRKLYVQLLRDDPARLRILLALRRLASGLPPPLPA